MTAKPTRQRLGTIAVLVAVASLFLAQHAVAGPFFSVGDQSDESWTAALLFPGRIMPVTTADVSLAAADAFFLGLGVTTRFPEPGDYNADDPVPLDDLTGAPKSPLLLSWEAIDLLPPTDYVFGGWEYVYDIDPDLTGTLLEFSVLNPVGTQHLSLELIDNAGKSRGWFLSDPPNAGFWTDYSIQPDAALLQSPFEFFFNELDFDITQVVAIRLGSTAIDGISITPSNPIPGRPPAWNAWGHLSVVPEPSTFTLAGLGLIGLLAFGWRRRRRA